MWFLLCVVLLVPISEACYPSITSVSGTCAPLFYCSGSLIFEDDFDELNFDKWEHENTLAGGGVSKFLHYKSFLCPVSNHNFGIESVDDLSSDIYLFAN